MLTLATSEKGILLVDRCEPFKVVRRKAKPPLGRFHSLPLRGYGRLMFSQPVSQSVSQEAFTSLPLQHAHVRDKLGQTQLVAIDV